MHCLGSSLAPPPVASWRFAQIVPRDVAGRTLGDPFTAIAAIGSSIIGGLFGKDAASSKAKEDRKAAEAIASSQIRQAEIVSAAQTAMMERQMKAAEAAARYEYQAASAKSDADLAAVREQYSSALEALRQQRMAAIDQGSANLVANTQAGIFQLAAQGTAEAGSTARRYPTAATVGMVVLAAATMYFLTRGKGKKRSLKIGGHTYEAAPTVGGAE